MKYYEATPGPRSEVGTKPDDQRKQRKGDKKGRAEESEVGRDFRSVITILAVLLEHHGCVSGKINNASLKQREIVAKSKELAERDKGKCCVVKQSTVSRLLPFIIFRDKNAKGAVAKYRRLCDDGQIGDLLKERQETYKRDRASFMGQETTTDSEEETGSGRRRLLEARSSPGKVSPKTPEELAIENEKAESFKRVVDGILLNVDQLCENQGVMFTISMRQEAEELAERKIRLWLREPPMNALTKCRSDDADETEAKLLRFLWDFALANIGNKVFEELQEARRRK